MSIKIDGLDDVVSMLEGVARRIDDPSPAMREVAERAAASTRSAVEARTAPDGEPWPARSQATVRRHGTRSTGRLAASISGSAGKRTATVRASVPHAAPVQYGTRYHAPRRFAPSGGSEGGSQATREHVAATVRRYVLDED